MTKFKKVYDPQGVKLFSMFSFDAGRVAGKLTTDNNWNMKIVPNEDIDGELYEFHPTVQTDKTVNFKAMSKKELQAKRNAEQAERVEKLANAYAMFADLPEDELEEACGDDGLCGLIDKPVWI